MDRIAKSKRTPEASVFIATNDTHPSAWKKTTTVQHTPDVDVHPVSDLLSTTTLEAVPMGAKRGVVATVALKVKDHVEAEGAPTMTVAWNLVKMIVKRSPRSIFLKSLASASQSTSRKNSKPSVKSKAFR